MTASNSASAQRAKHPLWQHMVPASLSGVLATIFTHPIDTVKLHLQLAGTTPAPSAASAAASAAAAAPRRSPGFLATFHQMARAEGARALYRGLLPSVLTTAVSSTTRLGLYDPLRTALTERSGRAEPSASIKAAAALATGALGSCFANPFHLVKVRLQRGDAHGYRGVAHAMTCIVRGQGAAALWIGTAPSMLRGALFSASQLATYDHFKGVIKQKAGLEEGIAAHVGAAMTAGVITTTASTPADVVKSVVMNSKQRLHPLKCFQQILYNEGLRGLMRGWTANYARLGPHTLINIVAYENLRTAMGWDNL